MPKSSKTFVITDSSLNEYDFRILTDGVDLSQFLKNPIVLWMHVRAWRGTKDEVLPIGYMTDVKKDGDQITGIPFFDDNDEFAMTIYNKVESGILKMCSGGFKILTWSDEAQYLLPGQKRSSAIKSVLREVSICDLGANNNALTLYDENDEVINLSDKSTIEIIPLINKSEDMTELKDIAKKLNLAENSTLDVVLSTVESTVKKNAELEAENLNLKDTARKSEIAIFLNDATRDGKTTAAERTTLETLADKDFDSVKSLVNSRPAHKSINQQLADDTATGSQVELAELLKLSYEELDMQGKAARLKDLDLNAFKAKFKAKYNVDYKGN